MALQVDLGLPWVDSLLRPDVQKVVRRTWFLTSWLKDIREAAKEADAIGRWQQIVDALVVADDTNLVAYSE